MKRLTNLEKKQLGLIIHYYRTQLFKSEVQNSDAYKQVNFCKDICSQAQLSRLEHGDSLKDQTVYEQLLSKLNLKLEKISIKDTDQFEKALIDLLIYQNDDDLIVNYNQYILLTNKYQNLFKNNIIYTHLNYVLEFILAILIGDLEEAEYLLEDVLGTLNILDNEFLVLTLHYVGLYYIKSGEFRKADQFFILCMENMVKNKIENHLIFVDIAHNMISMNKALTALDYLYKAKLVFDNTHNYFILERIYRYYSIIYLKERYYDECLENLAKASNFIANSNRLDLKSDLLYIKAIVHYLQGDYALSVILLKDAIDLFEDERMHLVKMIVELKLNSDNIYDYRFENERYSLIREFYYSDEHKKEDFFECTLKSNLNELPYELLLVVVNDLYTFFKEHKKYKRAVELFEDYLA